MKQLCVTEACWRGSVGGGGGGEEITSTETKENDWLGGLQSTPGMTNAAEERLLRCLEAVIMKTQRDSERLHDYTEADKSKSQPHVQII